MKKSPTLMLAFTLLLAGCMGSQGCSHGGKNEKKTSSTEKTTPAMPAINLKISLPGSGEVIHPGESFPFELSTPDSVKSKIDSMEVFLGSQKVAVLQKRLKTTITVRDINPANTFIRARTYLSDGNSIVSSVPVMVVSDIEPVKYTYRVIHEFPHDPKAYTQGFEYHHGYLYEGTGNYGESSLRKEDLETGEILQFRDLPGNIFGEGITLLHNKIYQITYKAQVGFVYNAHNFELLQKIYYQNKEGWGLCNNGKEILMTDGTNNVYFMDTTYFSVIRKIGVFDRKGEVDLLNELELINGKLYANRYTTNEIVIIDPETGKVEGKIDMNGILKPEDKHPGIDYFNGIAYDKEKKRIFVTGKYWPKIYQVEFLAVGKE